MHVTIVMNDGERRQYDNVRIVTAYLGAKLDGPEIIIHFSEYTRPVAYIPLNGVYSVTATDSPAS
jgi:hypothetical protein